MKLIVGLGNPGKEYENTRHNVGFRVVERLWKQKFSSLNFQFSNKFNADILDAGEVKLVKPQTFMNRSGETVGKLVRFYKISFEDLWVIHDDLDLRLGEFKIVLGKGPKIHGGINSINEQLGVVEYWRVRVGMDSRTTDKVIPGREYVLKPLESAEKVKVDEVVDEVVSSLWDKLGLEVA